ncbi:MAG: immunoglobulin domain-containing protein [Opitutales bacterium]|nr:immunoglobulin domain-containing protein [Opitutales bacterium]
MMNYLTTRKRLWIPLSLLALAGAGIWFASTGGEEQRPTASPESEPSRAEVETPASPSGEPAEVASEDREDPAEPARPGSVGGDRHPFLVDFGLQEGEVVTGSYLRRQEQRRELPLVEFFDDPQQLRRADEVRSGAEILSMGWSEADAEGYHRRVTLLEFPGDHLGPIRLEEMVAHPLAGVDAFGYGEANIEAPEPHILVVREDSAQYLKVELTGTHPEETLDSLGEVLAAETDRMISPVGIYRLRLKEIKPEGIIEAVEKTRDFAHREGGIRLVETDPLVRVADQAVTHPVYPYPATRAKKDFFNPEPDALPVPRSRTYGSPRQVPGETDGTFFHDGDVSGQEITIDTFDGDFYENEMEFETSEEETIPPGMDSIFDEHIYDQMAQILAPKGWTIRNAAIRHQGDPENEEPIIVGVLDTGVRLNHPDIEGNLWVNPEPGSNSFGIADDIHGINAIDQTGNPDDVDTNHGTHVAGTVGADGTREDGITGVAWDVEIMAIRFIGPNGGWTSGAVMGLDYMKEMGAHVGNHSWGGGGFSQMLVDAFERQKDADIISSVAAGNHHQNTHAFPLYPSYYSLINDTITTVMSATKREGSIPGHTTLLGGKDFFSAYGTATQIGAPGYNIWSLNSSWQSDGDLYRRMSGTSMSAPHIAGVMALLRAHFPEKNAVEIKDQLLDTSDWSNDLAGFNIVSGMANLYRALTEDAEENLTVALHVRPNIMDELSTGGFGVPSSGPLEELTRGHFLNGMLFPVGVTVYGYTGYEEWEEGVLDVELVATSEVIPLTGDAEIPEIPDETIELSAPTEDNFFLHNSDYRLPGSPGSLVYVTFTVTVSKDGFDPVVRELTVSVETPPENDSYQSATVIPPEGGSYRTNNRYANSDFSYDGYDAFGDPMMVAGHVSYKHLWWKWTPKYDTTVVIDTYGSELLEDEPISEFLEGFWNEENGYDTLLAVMTGTWPKESLRTLAANRFTDEYPEEDGVKRNWSRIEMDVEAGVEYTILVGSHYSFSGGVALNLDPNYPPPEVREEPPVQVTGILGQPVEISATVLWAETYEWRREGSISIPDGPQQDGDTLSFDALEMDHAGLYTLHAFNPYGESQTREVHLRVIDPAGMGTWATFNPWPTPHGLGGITSGSNGEQIAVGGSGTLLRKTDEEEWTAVPLGISASLSDVVYDASNDRFIAVGDRGTIVTGNGLDWEIQQVDGEPRLRSLVKGDGAFVAVGGVLDEGVILYSENGEDWTSVAPAGLTDVLYDVAWNGTAFVAVGGDPATGEGSVWQSTDGETWQEEVSGMNALLYGIDWWQNAWTVVGGNDDGAVLYQGGSASTLSAVSVDLPDPLYTVGHSDQWQTVGGEMGTLMTTTDGASWEVVESGTPYGLKAVTGGDGEMQVAGDVGVILDSTNGIDWSGGWGHRQSMEGVIMVPGGNRLSAVGDLSTALVSLEGSDWNIWSMGSGNERFFAVHFDEAGDELVAVGEYGRIKVSGERFATVPTLEGGEEVVKVATYGQEWKPQMSNEIEHLRGITGNGNDYVAVGSRGLILRSEDRSGNWQRISSPVNRRLNDVAWTGSEYLAVGERGILLRSTTGEHWQRQTAPMEVDLHAIGFFGGRTYVAADGGRIFHSADLQDWKSVQLDTEAGLFGLASGGGQLVAVGERGALFSTADGSDWEPHFSGVRTSLYDIVYQSGRFIAVGSMGTILSANPLPTVEPVEIDPEESIHPDAISVSLSTPTEGATIYYTLDGTRPDEEATLYEGSFPVEESTKVRARAFAVDHEPSGLSERQFIIGEAPFITVQPTSRAAALGGSTSFTVEVIGEEPFTYQWYRGETLLEEATSATLALSGLGAGDAGLYRVEVSNDLGTVESEEAELSLQEAPAFVSQPTDIYTYFGQTKTLEVEVSGEGPFTFEWLREDEVIAETSRSFFTIPSVSSYDVGRYQVIVRNAVGEAVSDSFHFYVNDQAEAPTIVAQPTDLEGLTGQPVTLEVGVTGSLPMEYTWYRNGSEVGTTSSPAFTVTLSEATEGSYSVRVENDHGYEISETAQVSLLTEGNLLDIALLNPTRSEVAIPEGMGLVLATEITEYGDETGSLGLLWEALDGPGEVSFDDPMHTHTTARFSEKGEYLLRLQAWNSLAEDSLEVRVLVVDEGAWQTGLDNHAANVAQVDPESHFLTSTAGSVGIEEGVLTFSNGEQIQRQGVVFNLPEGDYRLRKVGDKITVSFNWELHRDPTSTARVNTAFAWGLFSGAEADRDNWNSGSDWSGFIHHLPSTMGSTSGAYYAMAQQIPNNDLFYTLPFDSSHFFRTRTVAPMANETVPVTVTAERVRIDGEEYVEFTSRFPMSHSNSIDEEGVSTVRDVIWSLHKPSGAGEVLTMRAAYPIHYATTNFSGIGFDNRLHASTEGFSISDIQVQPVSSTKTFRNIGPLVAFPADEVSIPLDQTFSLEAGIKDDGLPRIPGAVTSLWDQMNGPFLDLPEPGALTMDLFPETPGMRTLRLYADDGEITTFADLRLGVSTSGETMPPEWVTMSLPDAVVGEAYETVVEATGGEGALTLSLEDGPAWLSLSDAGDGTATLSGTPDEEGEPTVILEVSDGTDSISQTLVLHVHPEGTVPGWPVISLGSPGEISMNSVEAVMELEAGKTPVTLELFVGLVDEGEDAEAWERVIPMGSRSLGSYVREITGLAPNTQYFYRVRASNAVGTAWSEVGEVVTASGPEGRAFTLRFPGYPGESAVQDFPLLVRLEEGLGGFSYEDLAYPETGADLRVYDADFNELSFAFQEWDPEGESLIWIRVPELDETTELTLFAGDASRDSLPAYTSDGAVWDDTFVSVWHLQEAAGEARQDSTPLGAQVESTGSSTVEQGPGIVGRAARFDGSNGNTVLSTVGAEAWPEHRFSRAFSLEGWIYLDPETNNASNSNYWRLLSLDSPYNNGAGYAVSLISGNRFETSVGTNPGVGSGKARKLLRSDMDDVVSAVPMGEWLYLHATWDGYVLRQYLNGILVGQDLDFDPTIAFGDNPPPLQLGATDNRSLAGRLDEVRLSQAPKSADWVRTTYVNIAETEYFLTLEPRVTGTDQPAFLTGAKPQAIVGEEYRYEIHLYAKDSDNLSLQAEGLPSWLSLNGTDNPRKYLLTGTPAEADVGDSEITLTAANNNGEAVQTFTLWVYPEGTVAGLPDFGDPEVLEPGTFATTVGIDLRVGEEPVEVHVWYGTSNGGSDPGAWDKSFRFPAREIGYFQRELEDLEEDTLYFFRFVAENEIGSVQSESLAFTTLRDLTDIYPVATLVNPGTDTVRIPDGVGLVLEAEVTETGGESENLSYSWELLSGPGSVSWETDEAAETVAWFSAEGQYELRFTADNGVNADQFEVSVEVVDPELVPDNTGDNIGPIVHSGEARTVDRGWLVELEGSYTDDGFPDPPGAVSLQWRLADGPEAITFSDEGVTEPTLIFPEAGDYRIRLQADDGLIETAHEVLITVEEGEPLPAEILEQPQALALVEGEPAEFSVLAQGNPRPSYQWEFNGNTLEGKNESLLTLTSPQIANEGIYRVVVSNDGATVTSEEAALELLPMAPGGFSATVIDPWRIELNWTYGGSVADGFRIDTAPASDGPWTELTTVGSGLRSYLDTTLDQNETRYYRLVAVRDGVDDSQPAEIVGATTPATGSIQLSTAATTVADTLGVVTFYAERVGGDYGPASAVYSTTDGTALDGTDYHGVDGVVHWDDGDTDPKPILIPILYRPDNPGDRDFTLSLSEAGAGIPLGSPDSTVVTIEDGTVPDTVTAGYYFFSKYENDPYGKADGIGTLTHASADALDAVDLSASGAVDISDASFSDWQTITHERHLWGSGWEARHFSNTSIPYDPDYDERDPGPGEGQNQEHIRFTVTNNSDEPQLISGFDFKIGSLVGADTSFKFYADIVIDDESVWDSGVALIGTRGGEIGEVDDETWPWHAASYEGISQSLLPGESATFRLYYNQGGTLNRLLGIGQFDAHFGGEPEAPDNPPAITAQPQDVTVDRLESADFSVTAEGEGDLQYQWFRNQEAIPGASSASYTAEAVEEEDAGAYQVMVWNHAGSVLSDPAELTVIDDREVPTITAWPEAAPIVFGESLAEATLSGGEASVPGSFEFLDPTEVPGHGLRIREVRFVPEDLTAYHIVEGTVEVEVQLVTPEIAVHDPSRVSFDEADLEAEVLAADASFELTLWYGRTEGGFEAGQWEESVDLGSPDLGAVTVPLTDLSDETTYYYRFVASNAEETVYSDVYSFTTLLDLSGIEVFIDLHRPTVNTVRVPEGMGLVLLTEVGETGGSSGLLEMNWEVIDADGEVDWDSTTEPETVAWFTEQGDYQLRLTASNGATTEEMDFFVEVVHPDEIMSQAETLDEEGDGLPDGWFSSSINSPSDPGDVVWDENGALVTGSSGDIWNDADTFHYVYTTVTGEVDFRARIASLEGIDGDPYQWAKSGLMVRETASPGSRMALATFLGDARADIYYRTETNEDADRPGDRPQLEVGYWMRIQRVGGTLTASYSADGENWSSLEEQTIPMGEELTVGLAASSHDNQPLIEILFDEIFLNGSPVGPSTGGGSSGGNIGPMIAAGESTTVEPDEEVTLEMYSVFDDGLPEEGELSWHWEQMSGPSIDFVPELINIIFAPQEIGEYVFRATAFDGEIMTTAPYITVTVESEELTPDPFEEWLEYYERDHQDPDTTTVQKGGRMVTLREAYLLGDDPDDPNDLLRITDIQRNEAEETMELYFPSLPDRYYTIEVSSDLQSESWVRYGEDSVSGDGETRSFTVPMETTEHPRRFYRVKVSFPEE